MARKRCKAEEIVAKPRKGRAWRTRYYSLAVDLENGSRATAESVRGMVRGLAHANVTKECRPGRINGETEDAGCINERS
jgi:hypothetical protein